MQNAVQKIGALKFREEVKMRRTFDVNHFNEK